jgi:hypothetical protein
MTHDPRPLRVVFDHLDQHQCLHSVIDKYGMDKDKVIYQYDNDPKHKAKRVQQWLAEQGYNAMDGRLSHLILILSNIPGSYCKVRYMHVSHL